VEAWRQSLAVPQRCPRRPDRNYRRNETTLAGESITSSGHCSPTSSSGKSSSHSKPKTRSIYTTPTWSRPPSRATTGRSTSARSTPS
jgi:hypothetical protein